MADRDDPVHTLEELRAIRERCGELPVLDDRTPDQILGYDDKGLPR
ncbi:MAG: type II toxin-antitoxin system VapB family antitoxin [Candidatus Solibacter usitatus]|nr:type II toxin-antitoxin system VapB family antitoxin [Candidatus Solibacter usitatus]